MMAHSVLTVFLTYVQIFNHALNLMPAVYAVFMQATNLHGCPCPFIHEPSLATFLILSIRHSMRMANVQMIRQMICEQELNNREQRPNKYLIPVRDLAKDL